MQSIKVFEVGVMVIYPLEDLLNLVVVCHHLKNDKKGIKLIVINIKYI